MKNPHYLLALEPEIPVAERCAILQEELDQPLQQFGAEVRWTRADGIRLTLAASELDSGQLQRLREELRSLAARTAPVSFETGGLTLVPSSAAPRIVAAEVRAGRDCRGLRDELLDLLGVPRDPHAPEPLGIMLGRVCSADSHRDLSPAVAPFSTSRLGLTTSRELVLLCSEIVRGHARTRVIERFPLRAPAAAA